MGQLTNLYVSQSYQGLLKMTDSTNGLTNTLQTVQTGDGDNSPLQMSFTEVNISGSLTVNGAPVTNVDTGSFATTGSNTFTGNQLITGSEGYVTLDGSTVGTNDNALFSIHANNDGPWIGRYFNDTFSTGSSILSFWGDNDGTFHFHNESTASIKFGVNNYGDNFILNDTNVTSNRDLIVSGAIKTDGAITFSNSAFNSLTEPSGALYFSSLSGGTLHLNDDGGEGDVYIGWGPNKTHFRGDVDITGSLYSTDIIGTGSLFLQPNQSDARYLEVYNTSPTDTHITASGGQIYLGDDQTYVKVDNYGSVERIDIVAGNELVVSSSVVNVTGSLHQSGTFYPDVIDWYSSSIVQNTGSYILTTDISGITQYDSYQNVADALQPYIQTGSIPSGTVSGSAQIAELGFATTGSVDALTGSIASLNAATSSYVTETESGSFVTNVTGSSATITVIKGNGSSSNITVNNVANATSSSYANNATSASFAQNALSASYAPDISNRNGLITTGSAGGNQSITGSLDVQGTISATSASFQYVTTVYETASVIYSSGSNQLGDASNDTQTLWGTVNLPSGPLVVTGSVSVSGSLDITGSIKQTTAFIGTGTNTAVTNSFIGNTFITGSGNGANALRVSGSIVSSRSATVGLSNSGSNGTLTNQGNNAFSATYGSGSATIIAAVYDNSTFETDFMIVATPTGSQVMDFNYGTSANNTWLQIPYNSGTNPSPQFKRSVVITGSLDVTGQANLNNNVIISGTLVTNASNKGLFVIQSEAGKSGSAQIINSISSSNAVTQSNLVFGNFAASAIATGSIVVSGSNNILMAGTRPSTVAQGTYGFINGNFNIFGGGTSTLTTSSVILPQTSNNINQGTLAMAFTTSSLAAPSFGSNFLVGTATFNHQSGSVQVNANFIAGGLTSTQQVTTAPAAPTIAQNVINATLNLNHTSSSISFQQNNVNGQATITSLFSGSFSAGTNAPLVQANAFVGTSNGVWISGSNSSAQTRAISNNIIGGLNTAVTSSLVSSNNAHLNGNIVFGQNLIVSASQAVTNGGGAFLGRYNDASTLSDSQNIVFAVGTGTGTSNRRTGLYIDSGSNVVTSGSLTSIGNATVSGSFTATGSLHKFVGPINQTGSLTISGSQHTINGALNQLGGTVSLSGSQLNTNNFVVWNGSPNTAGYLDNFVGAFMIDRNSFVFNNIVQSSLSSGSNFTLTTNTGSNYTNQYWASTWAGTETRFTLGNSNGFRNMEMVADQIKMTGSLNLSGSLDIANAGDLSMYGHKMFNVGTFYDTTTQSGSAAVSQSIRYNTTDISQGVTVASNSRLTVTNAGTYNIQFSAQLIGDTGADDVWIWLKKNGTNVTDSAGKITLANNEALIATWNYVVTASAGDYFEIVWQNLNGDAVILAETASGNIPGIPSIITTVTQVR